MITVYQARKAGTEYCQTDGSEHYKQGEIEPMDLIINLGLADGFCRGNIIKYAARYGKTKNLEDLKKVVDYAHILCGLGVLKNDKL
jgi:hypothetical protein